MRRGNRLHVIFDDLVQGLRSCLFAVFSLHLNLAVRAIVFLVLGLRNVASLRCIVVLLPHIVGRDPLLEMRLGDRTLQIGEDSSVCYSSLVYLLLQVRIDLKPDWSGGGAFLL